MVILIIVEYILYALAYSIPAVILSYLASNCIDGVEFTRQTFAFILAVMLVIRFVMDFTITWRFRKED